MPSRFFTSLLLAAFSLPISAQVDCGDWITTDRTFDRDVHCSHHHWVGANIVADGVTIRLNGHVFSGGGLVGFDVQADNVRIIGPGTIKGFSWGIGGMETRGLVVRDLVLGDMEAAMLLNGARDALITDNRFISMTSEGLYLNSFDRSGTPVPSTGNRILRNEFEDMPTGVRLCGYASTHQEIAENHFIGIVDYAVHLETGANHNRIRNNWFENGPMTTGIRLSNASMNELIANWMHGGRVGISIHDNLGAINTNCTAPPMTMVVTGNSMERNTVIEHEVGVSFGLGAVGSPVVIANRLQDTKLYDNRIGIHFKADSGFNETLGNAYNGTATPVIDEGTDNVH
jgi:nitrous oxidase accessory protein NosD